MSNPTVAWIASGRLLVKRNGGAVEEIESDFARETLERRMRSQQLHGWKGRSGVWGNMGMAPPEFSQWNEDVAPQRLIRFCGLTRGEKPDQLFYVLDLGDVGGLFEYDLDKGYESRLMHKEGFATPDISRHPETGDVAVSLYREDGTTGIVIGENDGRFLSSVTVSDSNDEAPTWCGDGSKRIVYQSAGYLRDENGVAAGKSTYRIELLDIENEKIETVLEADDHDLLQPRVLKDGTLYFIRRPYRPAGPQRSIWDDFKDIVLFPWRLALAFFAFLNFFAMMFTGKPLSTGMDPRKQALEQSRYLTLWGQMIDTRKAMAKGRKDEPKRLVPSDWQLIRRAPDESESVIADHVLS